MASRRSTRVRCWALLSDGAIEGSVTLTSPLLSQASIWQRMCGHWGAKVRTHVALTSCLLSFRRGNPTSAESGRARTSRRVTAALMRIVCIYGCTELILRPLFPRLQNMDKYLEARGVPYLKRLVICARSSKQAAFGRHFTSIADRSFASAVCSATSAKRDTDHQAQRG